MDATLSVVKVTHCTQLQFLAMFVDSLAHTFSLNLTRLIRTPVNADNRYLFLAQSTDSHRRSTLLLQTLHYQLCVLINHSLFLNVKKTFSYLNSTSMFSVLPHTGYDDLKTPISDYFGIKRVMQRPFLIKQCTDERFLGVSVYLVRRMTDL